MPVCVCLYLQIKKKTVRVILQPKTPPAANATWPNSTFTPSYSILLYYSSSILLHIALLASSAAFPIFPNKVFQSFQSLYTFTVCAGYVWALSFSQWGHSIWSPQEINHTCHTFLVLKEYGISSFCFHQISFIFPIRKISWFHFFKKKDMCGLSLEVFIFFQARMESGQALASIWKRSNVL